MMFIRKDFNDCINKSKKRLIRNRKKFTKLYRFSKETEIPYEITLGIYLIETYYRPWYYRFIEYNILNINLLLSYIFNVPIKNYTIGVFQLGVGTILASYENNCLINRYNNRITINKCVYILRIIKAYFLYRNFCVFSYWLKEVFNFKCKNVCNSELRNIGYAYNQPV